MTIKEEFDQEMKEVMKFYMSANEYTAWICWQGNMEYLCTTEKKLVEHDVSFLSAWNAAHGKGSYERTRIRLLGRKYQKMHMPEFMKLVECECGWTLYSMYGRPVECPKCYKIVEKEKDDGTDSDSANMVSSQLLRWLESTAIQSTSLNEPNNEGYERRITHDLTNTGRMW